MDMRGLSVFISEIRKSTTKEAEQKRVDKELAKIRTKFKTSANLKGYDRKKYVSKLLYIYMLGYDIDFGHIEAVNLLSADKYSEKHTGYLACTLLLNEGHELLTLITNSIKRDLASRDPNDQCLGLTAIANIGGKEQAEALADDVQKLLLSGDTKLLVRKKAALTLLRLYRKYPEILPPDAWASRVIALLNGKDLGVITSVMSLILGMVEKDPKSYVEAVQKAIRLLVKLVLNREYSNNYLYYGIPAPWLQCKLLQLLQYYSVPTDEGLMSHITQVINRIITGAERSKQNDKNKGVSKTNAAHSVFFEALNVAIHYDLDKTVLITATQILGKYLSERDTNLRYLSLDTMSRMAYSQHNEVIVNIRKNQDTILLALKDPDISIRRRALDLLYSMCNKVNAGQIVGELLSYLPLSDYAIREELVLKVAILAEKFAVDLSWYVDVILNLVSTAGDYVSDDIWHRVVQIVTNRDEDLQSYTSQTVFIAMSSVAAHENTIKLGSYILGEFGYLISNKEQFVPALQLDLLMSKFDMVSVPTKCMMLSAYMKFYNLYIQDSFVTDSVKEIFSQHRTFIDAELQQRANEYYKMIESGNTKLLGTLLEAMPHFPERQSSVMKRIQDRDAERKRMRAHGGEGADEEEEEEPAAFIAPSQLLQQNIQLATQAPQTKTASLFDFLDDGVGTTALPNDEEDLGYNASSGDLSDFIGGGASSNYNAAPIGNNNIGGGDMLDEIFGGVPAGIGNNSSFNYQQDYGYQQPPQQSFTTNLASDAANLAAQRKQQMGGASIEDLMMATSLNEQAEQNAAVHQDAQNKLRQLLVSRDGVAIEDENLQVKFKSEFHGNKGRLNIFYGNKSNQTITQFRADVSQHPLLDVTMSNVTPLIAAKAQSSQYVNVVCKGAFSDAITLVLHFEFNRKFFRFNVKLPIAVHKFIEPLPLNSADAFFAQWNAIPKDTPQESVRIFKQSEQYLNVDNTKALLRDGFNIAVLENIDPSPLNVVAAGVFFGDNNNRTNVLLRIQVNAQKQVFRLTVRSQDEVLTQQVQQYVQQYLEGA
ncbi:AP-2 complex subunit alpha [Acrasis kona]|uniref:AP-2 complex subunit alpha n=1 Tax=Acrasis kona TaxID=1008807 RepID=A0AAW2ZB59_9EUKA